MSDPGSFRSAEPPAETTAELKNDIDSGRTGDKVADFDPAASPLGTDDEAAGTPPSQDRIALARRTERAPVSASDGPPRPGSAGIWIWAVAAAVLAIGAFLLFGR